MPEQRDPLSASELRAVYEGLGVRAYFMIQMDEQENPCDPYNIIRNYRQTEQPWRQTDDLDCTVSKKARTGEG